MEINLKIRNIVILGTFHPIRYDRYYFAKNEIVSADKILSNSKFLPELVVLDTIEFQLTITNTQMICNSKNPSEEGDEIAKLLIRILSSEVQYSISGSGINFNWFLKDNISIKELSRKYCYNEKNEIQRKIFSGDDASFGFYSSNDVKNTRLKLDVKPITFREATDNEDREALQFSFNFHKNYKEPKEASSEFLDLLNHYLFFREYAEKIIEMIS